MKFENFEDPKKKEEKEKDKDDDIEVLEEGEELKDDSDAEELDCSYGSAEDDKEDIKSDKEEQEYDGE